MEDSLKASIQGLKRVDQARKVRGWNRQSSIWAQNALTTVSTLKQFWRRERIQRDTFIRICGAVALHNWREIVDEKPQATSITDFSEMPEVSFFCDRNSELQQLEQWVLDEKCKLVGILGLGGMGKTALAVKLVEQVQSGFEYVIWRSLQSTPQLKDLLVELIHFFSSPQQRPMNRLRRLIARAPEVAQPQILADLEEQDLPALLNLLLSQLREHRCLLVLDDVDSALSYASVEPTEFANSVTDAPARLGDWKPEAKGYPQLLRRISHERHQSCLLLISREPPKELPHFVSETTNLMYLTGVSLTAAKEIVLSQGKVQAQDQHWQKLLDYTQGHPFVLKVMGGVIYQFMQGNLGVYLQRLEQSGFVFTDLSDLMDSYLAKLSIWEQEVLFWLAIASQPISFSALQTLLYSPQSQGQVINTLTLLQQRSLLNRDSQTFSIAPILHQHLRRQLLETLRTEILQQTPLILEQFALQIPHLPEEKDTAAVGAYSVPDFGAWVLNNIWQTRPIPDLQKHLQALLAATTPTQTYLIANLQFLLRAQ